MWKECNIHLLPSNEKSEISLGNTGKGIILHENIKPDYTNRTYQHLYITDDSEIREGDWIIWNSKVVQAINTKYHKTTKKIIATTDTSLNLSQIPKQFIEYYISEYNAGRKIDKVDVEFEGELYGGVYAIPKISANNEISIKPVEEKMYSREEVVELIKDFTMSTHQLILNKNPQRHEIINTWFKENLK